MHMGVPEDPRQSPGEGSEAKPRKTLRSMHTKYLRKY